MTVLIVDVLTWVQNFTVRIKFTVYLVAENRDIQIKDILTDCLLV